MKGQYNNSPKRDDYVPIRLKPDNFNERILSRYEEDRPNRRSGLLAVALICLGIATTIILVCLALL